VSAPAGIYALEHEPYKEGAPLVVLVHGTMDRSASFGRVVRQLGDLHVIAYDRRGYGRSAGAVPPAASIHDHAADLIALLDGRAATVVGHSYGGVVAMLASVEQPEVVRALGVFEAPLHWHPDWPKGWVSDRPGFAARLQAGDTHGAVEDFLRHVAGDDQWETLPEKTKSARQAEGPALVADIGSLSVDPPFEVEAVRAPLVVGTGGNSKEHQRGGADLLSRITGAPLVTIEGAGHLAHLTHPEQFARFVRRAVALGVEADARG